MNGLLSTVPMAVLTESRTLFELGLVVVLAAAAPLIRELGVFYLIPELAGGSTRS